MINNNQSFIKLFWSYAMIIIIPVFILGFITINILFENLASDTEQLNMNIITQSADIADKEIGKTASMFHQIEHDEKIRNFVQSQLSGKNTNQYEMYDIMNELKMLKTDIAICQSAGIQINSKDLVITDRFASNQKDFYNINFNENSLSSEKLNEIFENVGLKNVYIPFSNTNDEEIIISCKVMNIEGSTGKANVFALISKDVLISKIMQNKIGNDFELAMFDSEGNILMSTNGFEPDKRKDFKSDNIVEIKSKVFDGKYIFKMSNGGLEGNVGHITIIFMLLMLIMVGVSVYLAYLHMQKMKKIILGVFDESKGLEDSLSEQLESAKERILSNLLYSIRTEAVSGIDSMSKYGICFSKEYFSVMTISDTQNGSTDIFSSVEETAWSQLNNIVKSKIAEINMYCEMVRTGTNTYSYILNYSTSGDTEKLAGLPAQIMNEYGIAINIGIGIETSTTEKLYLSYEGSVSALRYGLNEKPGDAVFFEEIHNIENEKIYYTVEKEKQLIRSVKMGIPSDAESILDEIYTVNFKERHITHSILKRLIFNLALTVYKILDESYELDIEKHEKYGRVCLNLFRNNDSEECFEILREIYISLCNDIGKQSGEDALKDRIVKYIDNNYSNCNLSLELLADHMEISYHYLSRLFKEFMGTNFVSYLTLIRLEKAKELLKSTDFTIEAIAEKTGFLGSNSLIRAFKKYYDITPGKYRKN